MAKRIKILFVAPNLACGGMETQLIVLINNMDKNVFDPCLILFRNKIAYSLPKGLKYEVLSKKKKIDIVFAIKLFVAIRKKKPDIIYGTISGVNEYCQIVGNLLRVPVITSMRCSDKFKSYRTMLLLGKVFPSKAIVSNSKKATLQLENYGLRKQSELYTIPNGVDTVRFKPKNSDANCQVKCIKGGNSFRLLYVGRITERKNVLFYLNSLSYIPEREYVFWVIGLAEDAQYYESCKKCSENRKNVYFDDPKVDIEKYYNWADAVVLPSLYEGTPNVILEAMACGKPILVSETADTEGIVENGKNGYRFNPKSQIQAKDATLKLIKEYPFHEKYEKENRGKIQEYFSVDNLKKKTEEVIRKHAKSRG